MGFPRSCTGQCNSWASFKSLNLKSSASRIPWRDLANGEKLDKRLGVGLGGPRSEAFLVDLERAYSRFECRTRNPKPCRRPRWSEHPSATRTQRPLDERLLVSGQRARQRARVFDRDSCGQPTLIHREFVVVADDHRTLDHV